MKPNKVLMAKGEKLFRDTVRLSVRVGRSLIGSTFRPPKNAVIEDRLRSGIEDQLRLFDGILGHSLRVAGRDPDIVWRHFLVGCRLAGLVLNGAWWETRMESMRNKKDPLRKARQSKAQSFADKMRREASGVTFTKTGMIRSIFEETRIPISTLKDWTCSGSLRLPLHPTE
jgi:hypothetical protein